MGMYDSGGGQQTSSTSVTYSPSEQKARDSIAVNADSIFRNSIQSNNGQYTGAKPAGVSSITQQGWGDTLAAADKIKTNTSKTQEVNDYLMRNTLNVDSNTHLQGAMDAATRPMVEQFMMAGGPMSAIRNNSATNGTYGGSRQGIAEGIATRGLAQEVGDMRQTMASDAYDKGLDASGAAVKNQAMLSMMAQMPGQMRSAVGANYEGYNQQNENYMAASRDYAKNYQWEPLQNYANIVYGGSNGTTNSTQSIPKTDNTGAVIGGLGSLAMMAMMM